MGSRVRYACYGKEMLGWIREKMATPKSAPGSGRFSAFGSITARNNILACNNPCTPSGDYSTAIGNSSWINAHTSDLSSKASAVSWW